MKDPRNPQTPAVDDSLEIKRIEHALLDEPPFDDDELRAAEATRLALENGDDALVAVLRAALGEPAPLRHDELIRDALSSLPDVVARHEAPATEDERLAAEALAVALDGGAPAHELPEHHLVLALQAAHSPRPIAPLRNELLLARALASKSKRSRPALRYFGGALALAASVFLVFQVSRTSAPPDPRSAEAVAAPTFSQSRSTAELFDPATPFPRTGGTTSRMDRIATARAAELRDNRFAAWGVR